ncbi:RNA polymerase sigma factor [Crystallibacter degradans]|uniref:RNA polymerase sigma factor n=1 Tax=Crystallibacter degradans TaxID=2726743 RepID=UPI001473FB52|nr:sigma-70 family RNA polymerase sigma factor [Arthrobacter sp. SF27]NMR30747.1 sigma-70 family RNA polymerase sigma factor [Arthrobacter sp. SF27]
MKPFEQLVTEHGAMVLRVCRAVLGPDEAEDAWSETFLSALKAYPELPEEANTEAWLVTIAHRKAIDVTRKRSRNPLPLGELPDRPSADPPEEDQDLWDAVKALPDRQREAIAYHYLAGLPHREVAAITGSTPEAVRRAASDGIKNLRRTYLAPAAASLAPVPLPVGFVPAPTSISVSKGETR